MMQLQLRHFVQDERGVFAVWLGVMLAPLLLAISVGVDLMQAVNLRTQLQAAVDSAALAGATDYTSPTASATATTTATRYMNNAIANLPANTNVSFTVTPIASTSSGGSVYAMMVAAQATIRAPLAPYIFNNLTVGVSARAQNPVYTATFSLSSFASNASDANSIYWYIVPADGGTPTSSMLNLLFSNTAPNNSRSVNVTVTAGQKIGFAVKNVTGGISPYLLNGYGGFLGSSHYFYSHLFPPSSQSYPSVKTNCSVQTLMSGTSSTIKNGSCLSMPPAVPSVNCSAASGKTITYYWNDMGGLLDDKDYNDAVFKIYCAPNSASTQIGVVLTQ